MTGYPRGGRPRRPVDRSWLFAAWGVPLAAAAAITIMTAGFGALVFVAAVMVGIVATVLHFARTGS